MLCLLLFGFGAVAAQVQAQAGSLGDAKANSAIKALPSDMAGKTLIVGTKVAPPFVMRDEDGQWSGLSIDLWEQVAGKLGLKTQFVERKLPALFSDLQSGDINVAAAALTVTAQREARIDFTYPFYTSGLAIAVSDEGGNVVWQTVKRFFSWQFLTAIGVLIGILLIAGAAVWFFERRRNAEEFGGSAAHGLAEGFWWAAVTMTTVGYGDKSPRTLGGRIIGLIWMFAAVIIISSLTAAIATSLTVNSLSSGVQGVDDLAHVKVETVTGSAAAEALQDRGIAFKSRDSLEEALDDLAQGRTSAVVYDEPLMKYIVDRQYPGKITVLDGTFDRDDYAFALPQGSPLREPINRAILAVMSSNEWAQLLTRYIGAPN